MQVSAALNYRAFVGVFDRLAKGGEAFFAPSLPIFSTNSPANGFKFRFTENSHSRILANAVISKKTGTFL